MGRVGEDRKTVSGYGLAECGRGGDVGWWEGGEGVC